MTMKQDLEAGGKVQTIHATSIAIGGYGVLLTGPSGAGKSDLALRLIDRGASLISDDYTLLIPDGEGLIADAPVTIAGKLEIRGIGIVAQPPCGKTPVRLIVELTNDIERLPPSPLTRTVAGVDLAFMKLSPFEASAPIKLEWMLRHILSGVA